MYISFQLGISNSTLNALQEVVKSFNDNYNNNKNSTEEFEVANTDKNQ
jgi:hypothetical protein